MKVISSNNFLEKFYRDRLAIFGLITLTIIILAVMIGPLIYQTSIDEIDFSQASSLPVLTILSAQIPSDKTS